MNLTTDSDIIDLCEFWGYTISLEDDDPRGKTYLVYKQGRNNPFLRISETLLDPDTVTLTLLDPKIKENQTRCFKQHLHDYLLRTFESDSRRRYRIYFAKELANFLHRSMTGVTIDFDTATLELKGKANSDLHVEDWELRVVFADGFSKDEHMVYKHMVYMTTDKEKHCVSAETDAEVFAIVRAWVTMHTFRWY